MTAGPWRHYDALQLLVAQIARMHPGWEPPPAVVEVLEQLFDEAAVSVNGNLRKAADTLDHVVRVTPQEAGDEVGLSARRVRQLAAAGLVRSHRHGGGRALLVDLNDLHRYLRERSA